MSSTKEVVKFMLYTLLACILVLIVFLCFELFSFTKERKKVGDLVYVFDESTSDLSYDFDNTVDTSEQFLSYGISYGIDVSEWQGVIDWEKVASSGISFAMIRCGFRETVGSRVKEDDKFRKNIEGATKAGLNVGVYFFGTAKNEKEALEEAEFTYNLIKDYHLTYPVAYDIELFDSGRLSKTSYSKISDNVLTFTETLASHGYETMVYSYKNAFTNILDTGKFDGKMIWLAHFTKNTDYKGNYVMWQYSESGRVKGIKTNVDLNISYFRYVDNIDDVVDNPNNKDVTDEDMTDVFETVKVKRQGILRSSPSTSIPNKLGKINKNTKLVRTGINSKFSRVLYNEKEAYIENSYLVKIS